MTLIALLSFHVTHSLLLFYFFFFNDTATTEIYTLSLHDALPISRAAEHGAYGREDLAKLVVKVARYLAKGLLLYVDEFPGDRKSTRLNSSHLVISYAVFCLKKKKKMNTVVALAFTVAAVRLAHIP